MLQLTTRQGCCSAGFDELSGQTPGARADSGENGQGDFLHRLNRTSPFMRLNIGPASVCPSCFTDLSCLPSTARFCFLVRYPLPDRLAPPLPLNPLNPGISKVRSRLRSVDRTHPHLPHMTLLKGVRHEDFHEQGCLQGQGAVQSLLPGWVRVGRLDQAPSVCTDCPQLPFQLSFFTAFVTFDTISCFIHAASKCRRSSRAIRSMWVKCSTATFPSSSCTNANGKTFIFCRATTASSMDSATARTTRMCTRSLTHFQRRPHIF